MSDRRRLDVSRLPTHAFGARDPVFWAVVLLIAIEATMFALFLVSYFYIRGNEALWPPEGVGSPDLTWGTVSAVLLFASAPAVHMTNRAAYGKSVRGMVFWTGVWTLLFAASLAARWIELERVPFRWDSHAYGSVFWTIVGMHTFHLVTGVVEGVLTLAILQRAHVIEDKLPVDVHVTGTYTYFVIASWMVLYPILYLERTVF